MAAQVANRIDREALIAAIDSAQSQTEIQAALEKAIASSGLEAVDLTSVEHRRQLYFGDNLGWLRELPSGHVTLCATDPPFNSGRDYNMFILNSEAQETAFKDTWKWDEAAMEIRDEIKNMAFNDSYYRQTHVDSFNMEDTQQAYVRVSKYLEGWDIMFGSTTEGKVSSMRAYLTFMAPRLIEIRRVLADIGSLYLHCDPTASAHLRLLLDTIFGQQNFRNEIVWHYTGGGRSKTYFSRKHDVILWYAKSTADDYCFNLDEIRVPYKETSGYAKSGIISKAGKQYKPNPKGTPVDDVWDIPIINPMSKERLGYPTQKPVSLYERIVKASSNEGDIVLDPFCGCGTTIDAAEALNRRWIGIDLTVLALEPIQRRMRERHGIEPHTDYPITGYPVNMQELRLMLADKGNKQRYKDAEAWAVTRIGMRPTKYIGDGGIDGKIDVEVWELVDGNLIRTPAKAVCEFKSTQQIVPSMIQAFRTAMEDEGAVVGIFIGLNPISAGVKETMRKAGTFEHNGQTIQRVQYWQITDDSFDANGRVSADIKLPYMPKPLYQSEAFVDENAQQSVL